MWYVMTEMQSTTAEDNSSKLADIYMYILYILWFYNAVIQQ